MIIKTSLVRVGECYHYNLVHLGGEKISMGFFKWLQIVDVKG